MEQKIEFDNLQELLDWIDNSQSCRVEETGEDYFVIEAPNNATWQIQYEKGDNIDRIISKTIMQLEKFDADDEFMELWSVDFAKRNQFKPSQFLKMLQEDEASFKELAEKLENVWH